MDQNAFEVIYQNSEIKTAYLSKISWKVGFAKPIYLIKLE